MKTLVVRTLMIGGGNKYDAYLPMVKINKEVKCLELPWDSVSTVGHTLWDVAGYQHWCRYKTTRFLTLEHLEMPKGYERLHHYYLTIEKPGKIASDWLIWSAFPKTRGTSEPESGLTNEPSIYEWMDDKYAYEKGLQYLKTIEF